MTDTDYIKTAQKIGFKSPLIDNFSFVGRKREITKILVSVLSTQVTSIWIWGPRRVGKTSLSYQFHQNADLKIIRLSCEGMQWKGIDNFIHLIMDKCDLKYSIENTESPDMKLNKIANIATKDHHVILILDEFDLLAINLQQYEQALIRSTLQKYPFFGIIFITRVKPTELLQDFSDESSRLVGVCDIIRLPMLSRDEVSALIEIVEYFSNKKFGKWLSSWIFDRIAGYPICVQSLLRDILIFADSINSFPTQKELEKEEDLLYASCEEELRGFWRDLPLSIRKKLIRKENDISAKEKREFRSLNLLENDSPIKPSWLIEVGKESGLLIRGQHLPEFIELAQRLNDSIKICNEISLRKGNRQIFQVTQQFFRLFELARPISDETELNERINIIHKICIESTNSNELPQEDRCLIPKNLRPIYKKSEGFQTVIAWRNFCFHDPSQGLKLTDSSKRYTNIGQICCKYLGPDCYQPQNKRDFNRIYKGILSDITDSVDQLRNALMENNGKDK